MIEAGVLAAILPSSKQNSAASAYPHVVSCTLKELLYCCQEPVPGTGLTGSLCIPEYQRPYVWKEKQINRLLNDLVAYKKEQKKVKPKYYLGSIILHHEGGNLKIIDGQQRITTMLLIQSVTKPDPLPKIVYHVPTSINNIRYNHSYLRAVFAQQIVSFNGISIQDIVDFSEVNVTLIVTQTEDLAYTFFETQNTGGIRLSGSAIAKAHHLRAINSKSKVAYQARRWEEMDSEKLDDWINNLIKIRFWKKRDWQIFPFYRNDRRIKETVIEEFTERTIHQPGDTSYYYSQVLIVNGTQFQTHQSPYRQVRQPIYDGNNFLDYIQEYISLHHILFCNKSDHRVRSAFYKFRDNLLQGNDGTLFLKELTEIALVTYVSRFGFERLFEFALWVYRYIYSMRVSFDRNVREDSIFKFAYDKALLDTILDAFTIDALLAELKAFSYAFSDEHLENHKSKNRYVQCVKSYFGELNDICFTTAAQMHEGNEFDKVLIRAITRQLQNLDEHE